MLGLDCAQAIDGAAVRAAGYGFVMRYLSGIPGPKIIRAAEVTDLLAHTISVGLVFEDTENDMAGGSAAGAHNATVAAYEAHALGAPPGTVVYLANDQPGAPPGLREYVTAAGPVLQSNGLARGFYGNPDTGRMLLGAGLVDAIWAVETWGSRDLTSCAIVQRVRPPVTVGGVECDTDELLGPAAGLWGPVAPAVPPPPVLTAGLPNLFSGAAGGYVAVLQRLLVVHGVAVGVDGLFGPVTSDHVREFQQREGLAADGVVGPQTWAALLA